MSYYKRLKRPVKVLVLSYGENTNLLYDLKTKYGLQNILDEYYTSPASLDSFRLQNEQSFAKSVPQVISMSAFQDLSSLMADVKAKAHCQWLILLDEVTVGIGSQDFSSLHLDDNIEMVIAVNPTLSEEAFNVIQRDHLGWTAGRIRTRVGRVSLSNSTLPCPDALTDLH